MLSKTRELWGDQGNGTYYNPILNADYSDPDIVRVNGKYFMITSTFQLHPGMAILESTDLIHWRTVNYIVDNLEVLDPEMNWDRMGRYDQGIYAGSLRYLQWKEKDSAGSLISKSKWFMHTTLFATGMIVATADDIDGHWECQYMKDLHGMDVKTPFWDDNCPYWEFHADGTLHAAYMIASKPFSAWHLHLFKMSLDGRQLLDGDVRFMSVAGDTTRKRTGVTPDDAIFAGSDSGDPKGDVLDHYSGEIIPTTKNLTDTHKAAMNNDGDLLSVNNAFQYPNREGTIISDIFSVEASKIIRFGRETQIGNTAFSGRHGTNQFVRDYIYIFSSEYWETARIPLLRRAKSIYGDQFDSEGRYLGSGTAAEPGVFETQRICVNLTQPNDTREPNQGGFVDVPAQLSTDGQEHWYFLTHHGNNHIAPECRPTSLLPVTWIEGWPIIGQVSETGDYYSNGVPDIHATVYDGTGLNGNANNAIHHPQARFKPGTMMIACQKPPIQGVTSPWRFQDSDNFGEGENGGQQNSSTQKLSPIWQWNHVPRENYWSLSQRKGYLRMYAFSTVDGSDDFFKVGNVLCQKYVASKEVKAEIRLEIANMKEGQSAGLALFNGGISFAAIGIKKTGNILKLTINLVESDVMAKSDSILFRSDIDREAVNQFHFSIDDGNTFIPFGDPYELSCGGYRGECLGIYTYNNADVSDHETIVPDNQHAYGFIDVDYFKYCY